MMEISTKGRYSLRIITFLASRPEGIVVPKDEIAAAEGISPAYVQQLLARLAAAGLVHTRRGRHGGFVLARSAETITVADVLRVAEGEVRLVPCRQPGGCDRVLGCPARPFWMKTTAIIEELFQSTTVADLANGPQEA